MAASPDAQGRVEAAAQAVGVEPAQGGDPLTERGHVRSMEGAAPPAGSTAAPPGAALSGVAPPGEAAASAAGTPDAAWSWVS